jgi:GMP synthase (glutamine-hydrolysing)
MARIAVIQHVAHEILGTLHPLLKDADFRIRYLNYARVERAAIDIARYDALVILGGPMGAYQTDEHPHLAEEIEVIRRAIELERPVLGICLGAQLIAAALGARVYPAGLREIGWHEVRLTTEGKVDPILGRFQASEQIFQWHGDTFDLPAGAVHLATSDLCPHQAFRYGDSVYGLQFHLEVDGPQIERWLRLPANDADIAAMGGPSWAERIRQENPQHLPRLERATRGVFAGFIDLFARPKQG